MNSESETVPCLTNAQASLDRSEILVWSSAAKASSSLNPCGIGFLRGAGKQAVGDLVMKQDFESIRRIGPGAVRKQYDCVSIGVGEI